MNEYIQPRRPKIGESAAEGDEESQRQLHDIRSQRKASMASCRQRKPDQMGTSRTEVVARQLANEDHTTRNRYNLRQSLSNTEPLSTKGSRSATSTLAAPEPNGTLSAMFTISKYADDGDEILVSRRVRWAGKSATKRGRSQNDDDSEPEKSHVVLIKGEAAGIIVTAGNSGLTDSSQKEYVRCACWRDLRHADDSTRLHGSCGISVNRSNATELETELELRLRRTV